MLDHFIEVHDFRVKILYAHTHTHTHTHTWVFFSLVNL